MRAEIEFNSKNIEGWSRFPKEGKRKKIRIYDLAKGINDKPIKNISTPNGWLHNLVKIELVI